MAVVANRLCLSTEAVQAEAGGAVGSAAYLVGAFGSGLR